MLNEKNTLCQNCTTPRYRGIDHRCDQVLYTETQVIEFYRFGLKPIVDAVKKLRTINPSLYEDLRDADAAVEIIKSVGFYGRMAAWAIQERNQYRDAYLKFASDQIALEKTKPMLLPAHRNITMPRVLGAPYDLSPAALEPQTVFEYKGKIYRFSSFIPGKPLKIEEALKAIDAGWVPASPEPSPYVVESAAAQAVEDDYSQAAGFAKHTGKS